MSESSTSSTSNDSKGVFFIILSEVLLAVVNTVVKYVHAWSTQKMMIVRNSVDFCLCMAMWAFFRYEVPGLRVVSMCLFRGIFYITFICFLWASLKSCLPLGDVVALVVTFSPLFLVILARVLLGEKIPQMWPIQFALCSVGVLLINKPLTPDPTCPATSGLLPMAAAFAGALMNLASRNLKSVPPPILCMHNDVVALIYATVSQSMKSDDSSLFPEGIDRNFLLLVAAGTIGFAGLLCNIKGYQGVSVAAIASIAAYSSVPLGYTIQVVVFNEVFDVMSAAGATLIVCTNVFAILSRLAAERKERSEQEQLQQKLLSVEGGMPCHIS